MGSVGGDRSNKSENGQRFELHINSEKAQFV